MPKISVIIVTFNAAHVLQTCLNSIYIQPYPFIEIIIKDGSSTDGTLDVIKTNVGNIAHWESEPDEGIYDAMNKALEYVTGEWVYFIGADDVLFDGFSFLANQLADASNIYYGRVLIKGQPTAGPVKAYKHAKDTICHQAIIYPKTVFDTYRFNTKYKIAADHLLNMQCWSDKNYHFKFIDALVANFNDTGISMTQQDALFKKDKGVLILKHHGIIIWFRYMFRELKELVLPRKYGKKSYSQKQA